MRSGTGPNVEQAAEKDELADVISVVVNEKNRFGG